jgi:hypothetical protein
MMKIPKNYKNSIVDQIHKNIIFLRIFKKPVTYYSQMKKDGNRRKLLSINYIQH